jgi:hypothetical protein
MLLRLAISDSGCFHLHAERHDIVCIHSHRRYWGSSRNVMKRLFRSGHLVKGNGKQYFRKKAQISCAILY